MRRHAASRFVAAIAVLALACAPSATGPEGELAAGRARWARVASTSYTVTIERACECLPEMSGPVVVATLGYPTRFAVGDPAVDAPVYTVTELRLR